MWNDMRFRFSVPHFTRQSNAVIAFGESGLQNNARYAIQDINYINYKKSYQLNNEMQCRVMHCKSLWWTCSAIQYWEKRIRRSAWGRSTFLIMQSNTPSFFYFIQRTCSRNCNTKLIHSSVFATNTNVCIWFIQLGPQEAIYMLMPCLLSDAGSTQLRSITLEFSVQVWKFSMQSSHTLGRPCCKSRMFWQRHLFLFSSRLAKSTRLSPSRLHTSYLSFFLHRQNFWKIKFTQ